jgi:hypothetical protein
LELEGADDEEYLESGGNDGEEESALGGHCNEEELELEENDGKEFLQPLGKIDKEQLPIVSASSADSTQQFQQVNYPPSLNAMLVGELFFSLQRIGAGVQQTATVSYATNNKDQLKPPAAALGNL